MIECGLTAPFHPLSLPRLLGALPPGTRASFGGIESILPPAPASSGPVFWSLSCALVAAFGGI